MNRCALLLAALALAACGATSSPSTTPARPGDRVAAPGTVTGDAALYAEVKASTIPLPAGYDATMMCEGAATLGELVARWETEMGGAISASCEGARCRVDVATKLDPACDTATDVEGCDGSAWMLTFARTDAGEIDPATLMCMAAG